MNADAPLVILGAGLAGAATAWHLRSRGVRDVILLERESVPGVHSSGRNAAMVRRAMDDPRLQPLADESVAELRRGRIAEYRRTGSMLLGDGSDAAEEWIGGAQGTGVFEPEDGVIDVAGLLHAFLRGTDVRYGVEVQSLQTDGEGWRLLTTDGEQPARIVVNATGAWAGPLGELPLTPLKRHLFTTAPDPEIDAARPWLWDLTHGYYVRPESGGLLLCACDEIPSAPGDYSDEPAVLQDLLQKLAVHQPDWPEPQVIHHWTGQRTFAPDRLPVIGFDPREGDLFHVAGLGGHGVTLSWAVGRLAADLLLGLEDAAGAPWGGSRSSRTPPGYESGP